MTNYLHKNYSIYLFETPKETIDQNRSMLNDFLQFIKSQKVKPPFKFSYVGKIDALFSELSLLDNILIDFHGHSLTSDKEEQFFEFLKLKENESLKRLFSKLNNPKIQASEANTEMRKIASLIKALISESDFILLDSPEVELSLNAQEIFFDALKIHVETYDKNVLVSTFNKEFIYKYISYVVSRNAQSEFVISNLNYHDSFKFEREKFYKIKTNENVLKIKLPLKKPA